MRTMEHSYVGICVCLRTPVRAAATAIMLHCTDGRRHNLERLGGGEDENVEDSHYYRPISPHYG